MIFEDDETLRMYVEESLEHLADIENDLLSIESQGDNIDDDLINNVFRAAHSIKGGAGFMGLSAIKDLSHNLENILGLIRSKELSPTADMFSILLRAFDKLKDLIHEVESSNEADIDDLIQALIGVTSDTLPEEKQESLGDFIKIPHPLDARAFLMASAFDLEQAFKYGKYLYFLEFDMIKDIHQKSKNPFDIINSLLGSGSILDSKIDFESIGALDNAPPQSMPLLILFASIIEPDMAPILVDLDEEFVHHIPAEDIKPGGAAAEKKEAVQETAYTEAVSTPTPAPAEKTTSEELKAPITPKAEIKTDPVPARPPRFTEEHEEEVMEESDRNESRQKIQTSLRVNVDLLDTLMTLAGELVLSRNQLIQGIGSNNTRTTETAGQRIDMITSELQEAIMRTRMQPIANVFNKFTRIVRDLAQGLGKQVNLQIEGKDVELDKTIIEAINDPLTHLIRNSVDHGIETPDIRQRLLKPKAGTIKLKAFHEAGQVNIEIEDDGKGLNPDQIANSAFSKGLVAEQDIQHMNLKEKMNLIFLPGFSTAEAITDVSGRGVGMDVVKTNLERLGGIIDIESKIDVGTTIRIKLPLTLAIIPSQIISVGRERYAIPQVNLNELLRIPAAQVKDRIEKVGKAAVVRLRGTLLPLLDFAQVLGIEKAYIDPDTGEEKPDRRGNIADRRSKQLLDGSAGEEGFNKTKRTGEDRRFRAESAINIAVVSTGSFRYGLVVDHLRDSEEIVVKPLGRHLKDCKGYAGATIMGDGRVALILDVASLAEMGNLSASSASKMIAHSEEALEKGLAKEDKASLLLFRNTEAEQFGVPLNLVERIERIKAADIELVGGKRVVQYRGGSLPLYELSEVANIQPLPERDQIEVIVFRITGREIGLMVSPPVDAVETTLNIDDVTLKQTGIMGSMIISNKTTLMVDMFDMIKTLHPDWFTGLSVNNRQDSIKEGKPVKENPKILFAEDSTFFRNQVAGFLEEHGYEVIVAEDGVEAFKLLEKHSEEIDLILTDLEMPNMDGFELTQKIKSDPRFSHFTVIALTSLAGEEDIVRGKAAGIDDYQIKLDRENLLISIRDTMVGIS